MYQGLCYSVAYEGTLGDNLLMNVHPQVFSSVVQLCLTLCDPIDCNLPGFSVYGIFQEEYWSELLFPTPGDLPDSGMEPTSVASLSLAGRFFTWEAILMYAKA